MPGRVLVVEDTGSNRLIISTKLRQAYYEVVEAESGEQAFSAVAEQKPDIILLDVIMPGIDGFEVCRRLKADPETLHIPVVMLTALDKREDRVAGLEAGADDFLTKPVDDLALMSRVASLLRMKMMVDEIALRDRSAPGLGGPDIHATASATRFPESRVLIVARSESEAETLENTIAANFGCPSEIAVSLDEATSLLDFQSFDAVLIDHALGGEAALRFGTSLRARPESRHAAMLLILKEQATELAAKALEIGFHDFISRPIDLAELTARLRSQLRRKHYADRLRDNMRSTIEQAVTDPLTGLYNRRYADIHLDALIERARLKESGLAVVILDLDHFKSVNDTFGHSAGDIVLREFSRRLQDNVRGVDLVARIGGEEFMVVMPDAGEAAAREITERIRQATEEPEFVVDEDGTSLRVTVSIGCATLEPHESTFELMKRADSALYQSKHGGRNRITFSRAA